MAKNNAFPAGLTRLTASAGGVVLFLVAYAALWTLIPYFSNSGLPVDTVEEVAWSREWPLGIYRHPPMMVWLLEIAWTACRGWIGSPYLLSGLAFGVGVFFFYLLLRGTRPASQAGLAALLTPLVYFFGPQLPQWNANITQLPFAGLFLLAAWRGVMAQSLPMMILAGLAAGGGVLGKYSFGLIPLFAAIGLLANPLTRGRVRVSHVLAAFVVFLITLLPHGWWFLTAPVNTVDYLKMSAEKVEGTLLGHVTSPILVVLEFCGLLLPAALIMRHGVRLSPAQAGPLIEDRALKSYLGFSVLGPVAVAAFVGAYGGGMVKDQWLIAYMIAAPSMLLMFLLPPGMAVRWKMSAGILFVAALALLAASYPAERQLHYLRANGRPVDWAPLLPPGPLTADALTFWNETLARTGQPPRLPAIVVGGFEAAAVANTLPVRPTWLEHFDPSLSPWVTSEEIRRNGVLATDDPPADFAGRFGLCVAGQKTVNWLNGHGTIGRSVPLTVFLPDGLCHSGT